MKQPVPPDAKQAVLLFKRKALSGLTLLELVTVVVIILILATMLMPAYKWYQDRAAQVNCTNNLKALYVAAGAYVQSNGHWPQIRMKSGQSMKYSKEWIEALKPFGMAHVNWICPGAQRALGGPDFTNEKTFRVDYTGGSFDDDQSTPYKWAKHPWFVERANIHGEGPLLITSDGSVLDLKAAMKIKNEAPK